MRYVISNNALQIEGKQFIHRQLQNWTGWIKSADYNYWIIDAKCYLSFKSQPYSFFLFILVTYVIIKESSSVNNFNNCIDEDEDVFYNKHLEKCSIIFSIKSIRDVPRHPQQGVGCVMRRESGIGHSFGILKWESKMRVMAWHQ